MPKLNNDVEITLDGDTHLLRPSLKAATAISRQYNGLAGAIEGALNGNLDVYQFVVKTGIVTAKNISTEDLREMVWRAGMTNLAQPIGRYIGVLQNGGKAADADDEQETPEAPEGDEGNGRGD